MSTDFIEPGAGGGGSHRSVRRESVGKRNTGEGKHTQWETFGFDRDEGKRPETHRPRVEVLNMSSIADRVYKPDLRPVRKPVAPPTKNPSGVQRPAWEK